MPEPAEPSVYEKKLQSFQSKYRKGFDGRKSKGTDYEQRMAALRKQAAKEGLDSQVYAAQANIPGNLIIVANEQCSYCRGYGLYRKVICACVWKGVFRSCYRHYYACDVATPHLRVGVIYDSLSASLPSIEYRADFYGVCMKACRTRIEQAIFKYHFIEHLDWKECLPILEKMEGREFGRDWFFQSVYRVELNLGRHLYSMHFFPLGDYFAVASGPRNIKFHPSIRSTRWMDPWLGGGNFWDAVKHMPIEVRNSYNWFRSQRERKKPPINSFEQTGTVVVRKQTKAGKYISMKLPQAAQDALPKL